jgi:hypothetical protein
MFSGRLKSLLDECIALNASTEERSMMSSWRVTLLGSVSAEATDPPGMLTKQ